MGVIPLHHQVVWMVTLVSFCTAVKFKQKTEAVDHQAHAKPGGPYYAVDWKGSGSSAITLSATDSHTHYFDHGPPPVSGTITHFEWYSGATGSLLLNTTSPYLSANFFLGITILKLIVTDSMGDRADAYTYVSVRKPEPDENEIPSIQYLSPDTGPTYGGTIVYVHGEGFYNGPIVIFGGLNIVPEVISETELRFKVPAVETARAVWVYVSNGFGTSGQYAAFRYVNIPGNPIKFQKDAIKNEHGEPYPLSEITSITIGPDRAYYAGSLTGFVHVLVLNKALYVQSHCRSDSAGNSRSILGVAFNPNEYWPIKLYITTSTLAWGAVGNGDGWDNGKVEVWGRKNSTDCLSHSYTPISGLPVSLRDHAINNLLFDADGSLLVAVGGSTNAGVHTNGDKTGGLPESPLSGSVLRFNIFDPSFDGHIVYSGYGDPGTANIASGTVEVFASGLRNVYGMTIHSNGRLYAMDNGPNAQFGVAATGCNTVGGNVWFADKLLHVGYKSYSGHPNWNRGRYDEVQCKYIPGDATNATADFNPPMAVLDSSVPGIIEYTANTFNNQLRGQLLLSKLSWEGEGKLWAAKLDESEVDLQSPPLVLFPDSGIAIEMGPYGELLMPKIKQDKIVVLVPDEPSSQKLSVIAVTPRRGPAIGGNYVFVTGSGFGPGMSIYFGEQECTAYGYMAEDGTGVFCKVPSYVAGTRNVAVVAKYGLVESKPSGHGEYEYMKA